MLIKLLDKAFNVTTFLVFGGCAGIVLALALPFQFFRPDVALLAELFADTRIERTAGFVEIALRFAPWLAAVVLVGIGAYLAIEKR